MTTPTVAVLVIPKRGGVHTSHPYQYPYIGGSLLDDFYQCTKTTSSFKITQLSTIKNHSHLSRLHTERMDSTTKPKFNGHIETTPSQSTTEFNQAEFTQHIKDRTSR